MSARFCCATQSAAGDVSTRPTHSQKPFPGAHESPKPVIASPFLHDDSKLEMPTTFVLAAADLVDDAVQRHDAGDALCTPQSCVFTPPVP
jgi:hypothetical protein